MKKFTKTLSIVLLIAMCVSMFAGSAFAAGTGDRCELACTGTVGGYIEGKEATCSEPGYVAHLKCDTCGASYDGATGKLLTEDEFIIPANDNHDWKAVAATEGDCKTPGYKEHAECSICGALRLNGVDIADKSELAVYGEHDWKLVEATEGDCKTPGYEKHAECAVCGALRLNGVDIADLSELAVYGEHDWKAVKATEGDCQNPGTMAHFECKVCGGLSLDKIDPVDAADLAVEADHSWVKVNATTGDCKTPGYEEHAKCSVCGALRQYGVDIADKSELAVYGEHNYVNGRCTVCGDKENVVKTFKVTGDASVDYASASSFKYQLADPDSFVLESITAGGYNLVRGAGFSYDSYTGSIVIDKAALSAIIDGKSSIDLVFTATDGSTCGGFVITNSDNIVVEDLYISGLSQNKYIQKSGKAVSFQTNLTDPTCVKIFSTTTQLDVPTSGYTFTAAYNDVYTYSFKSSFLDSLPCGNYQIRCYYGNSYSEYVTPGTLMISDSNTSENWDGSLYFVNSTQGDDSYFKYVSGDEVPRMHCELFLVDGARLQVSVNGGKSWSNVNVHNYYVEPNKKGDDTVHAWLGSDYLDSLNADTIYYFRVVVPASAIDNDADLVSNVVSVTTGPTLKAVDTAKHVINSTKNLRFVASEKIAKAYVGNVQLTDENDFNISNDGKTVTLSPSFLNKRTAGSTYTIKVLTANGEYASTTFQILTTAQASASPRTGDTSNIGLWTAVLMLSAGAAVAVLPRLKKD